MCCELSARFEATSFCAELEAELYARLRERSPWHSRKMRSFLTLSSVTDSRLLCHKAVLKKHLYGIETLNEKFYRLAMSDKISRSQQEKRQNKARVPLESKEST